MNKRDFLEKLTTKLAGFPEDRLSEILDFYSEQIDDRMDDEGISEEEAVRELGDIDLIVSDEIDNAPISKVVLGKVKPKRRLRGWETALIILGFPVWLPLLCAAGALLISLYAVFASVIVSLWAVAGSLVACAVGGAVAFIVFLSTGHLLQGFAMLGAGLVCAGVSIFAVIGCKAATKGLIWLYKKTMLGIKKSIIKGEARV